MQRKIRPFEQQVVGVQKLSYPSIHPGWNATSKMQEQNALASSPPTMRGSSSTLLIQSHLYKMETRHSISGVIFVMGEAVGVDGRKMLSCQAGRHLLPVQPKHWQRRSPTVLARAGFHHGLIGAAVRAQSSKAVAVLGHDQGVAGRRRLPTMLEEVVGFESLAFERNLEVDRMTTPVGAEEGLIVLGRYWERVEGYEAPVVSLGTLEHRVNGFSMMGLAQPAMGVSVEMA